MATLVLTAVGTAIGGPIGGAIGAIVGRTVDGAIFGGGGREGPRVKDLAVTTSSYGQPIARHAGQMRVPGTIIWATDLVEHRESSGGGKGKPKTTSYSYSISFAAALSSSPIDGIGRIWADGNLLRGAAGDLKVGGTLRVYRGRGDQLPDPLIAASLGNQCPASRGCAYAVFEDLDLSDFGNRIPALTFELFGAGGELALADLLLGAAIDTSAERKLPGLAGFAHEGGTFGSLLATIGSLYPIACDCAGDRLSLASEPGPGDASILLPPAASGWDDDNFGRQQGSENAREAADIPRPQAVRYYDTARDFQPGLQRAGGRAGEGYDRTIEFPGALSADTARSLVDDAARRARRRRETLSWRITELDPALHPGVLVRAPGIAGTWTITGWEWRERGVELTLARSAASANAGLVTDPGSLAPPLDLPAPQTVLQAFETPWDGTGSADSPRILAAASAASANWRGAALYAERAGELLPAANASRNRAVSGETISALGPSRALLFEPDAECDIRLAGADFALQPASLLGLAGGENRLLAGGEIIQFAEAEPLGEGVWRLRGLLRGRGGTEAAALAGCPPRTLVTLLDDRLVEVDPALASPAETTRIAAIGFGDSEPVFAPIANPGATLRPPAPVHPRSYMLADGSLELHWTRRARGQWAWPGEVDLPLVEQAELYRLGIGPIDAPFASWDAVEPRFVFDPASASGLAAGYPGLPLWVRQVGSHALSNPLLLLRIA